jgi:basic amino acid/polyamine antiporter, APA family
MTEAVTPSQNLVEKRSGLLRNLGFWETLVLAAASLGLFFSGNLPLAAIAGTWPGRNVLLIVFFALLVSVVYGYVYTSMGMVAPRTGANYVVPSRVLRGPWGFISSFIMTVIAALMAGNILVWIAKAALPTLIRSFSTITGNTSFDVLVDQIITPEGAMLVGTGALVLTFIFLMVRPELFKRILLVGMLLCVLAWVMMIIFLLTKPFYGSFESSWDNFMGAGMYGQQIDAARTLGMPSGATGGPLFLIGLMMGFWLFFGASFSTSFAGEVKNPQKTLWQTSAAALAGVGVLFIVLLALVQRWIDPLWLQAQSYLLLAGKETTAMPWLVYYVNVMHPNVIFSSFLSLAWLLSLLLTVQAFLFFCSRNMIAWAMDDVMFEGIGIIQPRTHVPVIALMVAAVVAELGVVLGVQLGALQMQTQYIFFAAIFQVIPILSMTLLPFLKKDWYEDASPLVRVKVLRIPVITLAGAISLLSLLWMAAGQLIRPIQGTAVALVGVVLFAVLTLVATLFYYFRVVSLRRAGKELKTLQSVLPPE